MRLERISVNQFKIFLTYNDLKERGYSKEDLWNNLPKANELFQDMLYEACDELDIDLDGNLIVQVSMLQAQGMVILVTQNESTSDTDTDFIELKVTMDESKDLMFVFNDIENVIEAIHQSKQHAFEASLYHYKGLYYLHLHDELLDEQMREIIVSILSEFGEPSTMTSYVLIERGKLIAERNALKILTQYFS